MSVRQSLFSSLLCVAMVSVAVPVTARAEPPPTPASNPSEADLERARELFDNGKSLYLDGSYEPAIAAFKQAYGMSGDALLLYNIAQAYDRAEDYDGAIEYFEYYRAFAPANERDALTEKVDSLQRRKIKAQADAEQAAQEQPSETTPSDDNGSTDSGESSSTASDGGEDDAPAGPKIFGPAAIALTAVAVVGLGTGTGLGLASRGRNGDAAALCTDDPILCPPEAQSDLDGGRRLALGADIAFGVGAAAAVGAIVVIALNARKRKKAQSAAAPTSRVAVGVMRRGASLSVRF